MEGNTPLEKVWQLSDEHELVKGIFEGRVSSHLTPDGQLLVANLGKALLGITVKNIFKKKPLFAFTLKADDCLPLFPVDSPDAEVDAVKNPFYLKNFFKAVEISRKPKKGKGETFRGLIGKLKDGRHHLHLPDLLVLYAAENARKETAIFRSFSSHSIHTDFYCLLETNLGDWVLLWFDSVHKTTLYRRVTALDESLAKLRIFGAHFAVGGSQPTLFLLCGTPAPEFVLVRARVGSNLATHVTKFPLQGLTAHFGTRLISGGVDEALLWTPQGSFHRLELGQPTRSGALAGQRHSKDWGNHTPATARETQCQVKETIFVPTQTEVRNHLVYILWPTRLAVLDTHKGTLREIHRNPLATYRKFVLLSSGFYLLDRQRIEYVAQNGRQSQTFEAREFDLLLDFQVSPNEFLVFLFGKKGDLFSHRCDLAVFRNLPAIAAQSSDCGVFEFLLFASNSFKIQIKRRNGSRSKGDGLEIADSPFFEVLGAKPLATALRLKAAYFRYSNDPKSFSGCKMGFLKSFSAGGELLRSLEEGSPSLGCPNKGCSGVLKGFTPSWLRATFSCGHRAFFAPDRGSLVRDASEEGRVCLRCETVYIDSPNCHLCLATLA